MFSCLDVALDLTEFIVHDEDEVWQKEQICDTMNTEGSGQTQSYANKRVVATQWKVTYKTKE